MICCLPFNASDQSRAERLLDSIYWIGGQKPIGHMLLAVGSDVHPEYKRKVEISAQVAFASVELLELKPATGTKPEQVNNVYRQVAKYVQDCYDRPWLYLEAECVPLKSTWLTDLFMAYSQQPKRYLGRYVEVDGKRSMSRTAIYPGDAFKDAGTKVSLCNSDLFHVVPWKDGMAIPPSAALLNGDKSGVLIEQLIEAAPVTTEVTVANRRGRGKKVTA